MEILSARLDALQEDLLSLYESNKNDIDSQIKHWMLLRKEYVIHYYARANSISRLGYQNILTQQVAQAKAHEAIEMVLNLETLKASPYGAEQWTLAQTSRELWLTPPKHCFKKEGSTVEVWFDGRKDNAMHYTAWDKIYYQTDSAWIKTDGHVDYDGCFYYEGTYKHYYIKFQEDADKYSQSGDWEVHFKHHVFSPVASVSSTTDGDPDPECGLRADVQRRVPEQHQVPLDNQATPRKRRRDETGGDPAGPCTPRRKARGDRCPHSRDTRGRRRGRDRGGGRGGRRQRREGDSEERQSQTEDSPDERFHPGLTAAQQHGQRQRTTAEEDPHSAAPLYRQEEGDRGEARQPYGSPRIPEEPAQQIDPNQLPRVRRQPARILDHLADTPILLLRGGANQLKCYRYRLLKNYFNLFLDISKTWQWIGAGGIGNKARVTVAFESLAQRNQFLNTVPIPTGVTVAWGRISGL
ncbi:E2 [Bovine papillomavirus]|uniref:Regulatory protein E2 n=1 Tax=Bovine papillomavirus TaxID=10571 RepID=A0A1Z3FWF2_9PAPI|nr:E2 [Bovine papillomavirus]ASC49551.1 E2 [Bovine papillomavirus]